MHGTHPPPAPWTGESAWDPDDEGALTFLGFEESYAPYKPDSAPMFQAESRTELAESILAEMLDGCAVLAVRGEKGMGKTSLMHLLAAEIQAHHLFVVMIGDPLDHPDEVHRIISEAAGLQVMESEPEWLLAALQVERSVEKFIVLVDQAEKLSTATLQALWRLASLRVAGAATMHLVLFGALGPWPGLKSRDLEVLRNATQSCYVVFPLRAQEAEAYLDFQLRLAGQSRQSVMTRRAARKLVEHARFIPGRINELAEEAVFCAARSGSGRMTLRSLPPPDSAVPQLAPPGILARDSPLPGLAGLLALLLLAVTASLSKSPSVPAAPSIPRAKLQPAARLLFVQDGLPAYVPASPVLPPQEIEPEPVLSASGDAAKTRGVPNKRPDPARTSARAESPERERDHGGAGLVLVAGPGDTIETLYARGYAGLIPPPYRDFIEANRSPIRRGSVVIFPEPPAGWSQRSSR